MYKIKNITTEQIFFVDTQGKGIMIPPGEQIVNKLPPKFGYTKKLEIEVQETPPQQIYKVCFVCLLNKQGPQ